MSNLYADKLTEQNAVKAGLMATAIDHVKKNELISESQKELAVQLAKNFISANESFLTSPNCDGTLSESALTKIQGKLSENNSFLSEAPTNVTAGIQTFNQKLTKVVMDAIPAMVGLELCGTHPLQGRTGLIPYTRMRYDNQSGADIFRRNDSFDTDKFGDQTLQSNDGRSSLPITGETDTTPADSIRDGYVVGQAMTTATGQDLGDGTAFDEVSMTLDSMSITCLERGAKAHWSMETDLFAQAEYGFNFGDNLIKTAKTALLRTVNEEVFSKFERAAKRISDTTFCQNTTANTVFDASNLPAGTSMDLGGKAGALYHVLNKEMGVIAKDTRFGLANKLVVSPNVAAFLSLTDKFRYNPSRPTNLSNDVTGQTLVAGQMANGVTVYIDPYSKNDYAMLVLKQDETTAGLYYCPFVPLWMTKGVDPKTGQNIVLLKSLYGLGASPYANSDAYTIGNSDATIRARVNRFARTMRVTNI